MPHHHKVLVITGPTATGKSALAIEIARVFAMSGVESEIISADSRQVYRGLDIGSAKITSKEMEGIPHHMIDVADPTEVFTVSEFKKLADTKITEIIARGKLPIICGGTGMYISAIINNQEFPQVPPDQKLRSELEQLTPEELFTKLEKLDPVRAQIIDSKNLPRLIRAIEIAKTLGSVPPLRITEEDSNLLIIALDLPKDELVQRIEKRIDDRIPALFDEITQLHAQGVSWERLASFGLEYRYGAEYVQEKITLEVFKKILATKTWQFVKRQMTWWKRDARVVWMNPILDKEKIIHLIQTYLG